MNSFELNKYLNIAGYSLQLSDEKFEELKNNYKALSTYIANNHKLAQKEEYSIYQQGSFAIDTAIRPLKNDSFDVDVIVEFDMNKSEITPMEFYRQLYKTFKEGKYSDKVEEYRNCIRINYSNNYHFDIMPAIPLAYNSESLSVPDKKKTDWVVRAPKTYARWFEEQSKKFALRDSFSHADVTPLKKPEPYELKPTLNRVVQLLKRSRDIYFKEYDDYYPQSIVLTTLAAKYYDGNTSLYDAFLNIVGKMKNLKDNNPRFDVINPGSNGRENFTEKWKRKTEYYDNFSFFIDYLYDNLIKMKTNSTFKSSFTKLFGDSITDKVKSRTMYDSIWEYKSNLVTENVFPNSRVTIEKKERGNA